VNDAACDGDVMRFRAALENCIGLQFEDAKLGFLGEVLHRRLGQFGGTVEAYLGRLETTSAEDEIAALARELTVGETYFFRNHEQFCALAEAVLAERMRANEATRTLRFLSAGCASGEEAYTLAIVASELIRDPSWTVSIRAVDLNPAALEKAARARFSPWALRETSLPVQQKWFRPDGREMVLETAARAAVTFEQCNLATEDRALWQPAAYDVIFCRNVMMYFAPEKAHALVARISRALQPGGYLFLGHAETLRGLSDAFQLRHTHDTFYYKLKEASGDAASFTLPVGRPANPALPQTPDDPASDWIEAIDGASERVAALLAALRPLDPADRTRPSCHDLAPAFDLLRTERFTEALVLLRALPRQHADSPDVLLLEATLLAHGGQLSEAETACRKLLLIDELNAGAHYLLALCRESAGDRTAAAEHDRVAIHLDPTFAMPRLHLGLLARRADDRETARHDLGQALVLLRREDAARLLLFGGGFTQDALIALCDTALQDCGGRG